MTETLAPVQLRYGVDLRYTVRSGAADFIFNVQAARTAQQSVLQESLTTSQFVPLQEHVDPVTGSRFLRLRAWTGELALRYSAVVEIQPVSELPQLVQESWIPALPGDVLPYLYPSRYCESDLLAAVATAQFGSLWQGYSRVQAVCDWVGRQLAFTQDSSTTATTAVQTLASGRGVCRDYAHLAIALCRALNIPARFVTGLDYGADPALGPTDFHAYMEAYLGGRWYLFDPSGTAIPMGFVRLASGRDAADCAYATIFGDVLPWGRTLTVEAVQGAGGVLPYRTASALSTA